jgi:sphingomyelin phosphodiesterase
MSLAVIDPKVELTPAFWHNVTELFETNDSVFQEYYARKQRGWDYTVCSGSCKTDEICEMRSAQSQHACLSPSAATKKKRGLDGLAWRKKEDECSHSTMRKVLRAIALDRLESARQSL